MSRSKSSHHRQINEEFATAIAQATRLHITYMCFKMARDHLEKSAFKDLKVRGYLELCCKVFALKQLSLDRHALYESGHFKKGHSHLLETGYHEVLRKLRPQMIPLVESFATQSKFVPSTIGNAFGDIYELQFETAKKSRINAENNLNSFYQAHMKPVMNLKRP